MVIGIPHNSVHVWKGRPIKQKALIFSVGSNKNYVKKILIVKGWLYVINLDLENLQPSIT